MAIFGCLFWILALILLLGIFTGVWMLVVYAMPERWRAAKAILAVLCLPTFALLVYGYVWHNGRPSVIFEDTFGFPVPDDVTDLRAERGGWADSGHVYLRFRASPATVARIAARGLAPVPQAAESGSLGEAAPEWLRPRAGTVYEGQFRNRNYASEREKLVYDPATGDAFFFMTGVD